MTFRPNEWARVKEVFAGAQSLPVERRPSYLTTVCQGDDALRQQVERLLASHDDAKTFLETRATAGFDSTTITRNLEGRRIGPYQLTSRIGAGGMGEVYKARDTRLDRTVAIKVLSAQIAHDRQARERFEREARIIGALNHPHICTLHAVRHRQPGRR